PIADFSGDCIVEMADVGIMGGVWLIHDVNYGLEGIQEPNDANLIGWWTLDGDACDSSIYDYNCTIEGTYSWVAGHNDANAADLAVEFTSDNEDKGGRILVPDDNNTPTLRPEHQVTACAWVYFTESQTSGRVVVKGKNDKETYNIEVDEKDQFNFMVRDVNGNKYSVPGDDDDDEDDKVGRIWTDDWIHLAGTYDGNEVKSYVNGELCGSTDANFVVAKGWTLSQDTTGLAIGSKPESLLGGNPFTGSINDVRVYDYALSQPEVAWLASNATGYVPLTSRINLYDEELPGYKAVNFKDFATLLDDWLERQFWPLED
ncbi:MAG: LamG domain-containing protein, partial [Planctomycetota bacterium]